METKSSMSAKRSKGKSPQRMTVLKRGLEGQTAMELNCGAQYKSAGLAACTNNGFGPKVTPHKLQTHLVRSKNSCASEQNWPETLLYQYGRGRLPLSHFRFLTISREEWKMDVRGVVVTLRSPSSK
ncbi:hypothetical protein I7I51_01809 [Histoplasma capsulatum]|uniref:Uncharacterized protein n=1 Tax=Ajellomyces capsulatus TaxID=5037 RepID=A0A8A1MDR0_AJECA|nr:hypothetical protein I7I51_01809 [Histoplasma capsulatum]